MLGIEQHCATSTRLTITITMPAIENTAKSNIHDSMNNIKKQQQTPVITTPVTTVIATTATAINNSNDDIVSTITIATLPTPIITTSIITIK